MTLYKWDTSLYDIIKYYTPRCLKSKWKQKKHYTNGVVHRLHMEELNMYVQNYDLYFAGVQILLNLGFITADKFPSGEYGILPHLIEDGKHVRKYTCTSTGGQMDYYYPYKLRTIIFR